MAVATAPIAPLTTVSALPDDAPTGTTLTCTSAAELTSALARVGAGGDLDQALNHVIEVQAGITLANAYFVLPAKTGVGWVTIRSTAWASLPAGTTVTAAQAALMPTFVCSMTVNPIIGDARSNTAIHVPDGSSGWRFIGLEVTLAAGLSLGQNQLIDQLVTIGGRADRLPNREHTPDGPPIASRVSVERCYIHGRPKVGAINPQLTKALVCNGNDVQVRDCLITEAHREREGAFYGPQECQAIFAGDSGGPLLIEHNHLEAAGQGILLYALFNSADLHGMSTVYGDPTNCIISDVIIRRNHVVNPTRWMNTDSGRKGADWDGSHYTVKQLIEFKCGRHVLCEGNLLENLWSGQGQAGQTPGYVGFYVEDIRFQYNIMKNCAGGFYLNSGNVTSTPSHLGNPNSLNDSWSFPAVATMRFRIAMLHNLWLNTDTAVIPGLTFGLFVAFGTTFTNGQYDHSTYADMWIEHNTVIGGLNVGTRAWVYVDAPNTSHERCTIRNNVYPYHTYGPSSDGHDVHGGQTDANKGFDGSFGTDRTWAKNVMYFSDFGQGDWNPSAFNLVGSLASAGINADGTLQVGSPLKAGGALQATDLTDNGVNFAALAFAQGGGGPTLPRATAGRASLAVF